MAVLKSTWQGKERVLDLESISSREYKVIKRHTGLRMGEFENAFQAAQRDGIDAEVVDCLLWLFLKRDGRECDPSTLDDYPVVKFMEGIDIVPEAEPSAEAEAGKDDPSTPENSI